MIVSMPKKFIWGTALLCLSYLLFQLFFIPHERLAADEFWFAHHIYEYVHHLPYRDFPPYKTILGYYILSLPLYLSYLPHEVFKPLYYIKYEIALINMLALGVVMCWLTRFFKPRAILLSAAIIISSQLFLMYSTELRVDMLTSWLCLISVLFLLDHRVKLSGFCIAIAFLISQKALWYFLATNCAMGLYWLSASRNWRGIWDIFIFNLIAVMTIAAYIIFWAYFSDFPTVLHNLFYEAYTQSKITWYAVVYYYFWQKIMANGPLLFFLWPLAFLGMLINKRSIFICTYVTTALICIVSYQQAFPYNMVFAIPAFFLLAADFFSWAAEPSIIHPIRINKRILFWLVSLYLTSMISLIIILDMPYAYAMIIFIPILVIIPNKLTQLILLITLFSGIIYPLIKFGATAATLNNRYQEYTILLADKLLDKKDSFFAGIPFLYNKNQSIAGLKNLIDPAIVYLYHPTKELLPILIPSLYLIPRTSQEIIQDLTSHPVKLYINNPRIEMLPPPIKKFLRTHYKHFWGSIYVYAPPTTPLKLNTAYQKDRPEEMFKHVGL